METEFECSYPSGAMSRSAPGRAPRFPSSRQQISLSVRAELQIQQDRSERTYPRRDCDFRTASSPLCNMTNDGWAILRENIASYIPQKALRSGASLFGVVELPPWSTEQLLKSAIGVIFATCFVLFGAPIYRWWYCVHSLRRIRVAFRSDQEPSLRLANLVKERERVQLAAGGISSESSSNHRWKRTFSVSMQRSEPFAAVGMPDDASRHCTTHPTAAPAPAATALPTTSRPTYGNTSRPPAQPCRRTTFPSPRQRARTVHTFPQAPHLLSNSRTALRSSREFAHRAPSSLPKLENLHSIKEISSK
ncbi:hypothetical protein PHLGIDRAFT_182380 [Phlebiopsis gigantea 11061_1 CR5-6]|uniref:Uncharacterized protein n=1 Tax=Phlebiopsis gigantea (strain 11061_1 CR5-6) TaxID=745531 RepID=A0A0C3NIH8_PHLG1|nr:hypothetical protein PHLGIDRAFT_182380 [Phlebiopsis gigantea 11061_1 CR5-6]